MKIKDKWKTENTKTTETCQKKISIKNTEAFFQPFFYPLTTKFTDM